MVSRWPSLAFVFSTIKPMDDFQHILENGINFGRGGDKPKESGKVKTKAKKKQYITGAHGSGSARQKAKYREQRANRHKK
jgi:hypothetical protein